MLQPSEKQELGWVLVFSYLSALPIPKHQSWGIRVTAAS